MKVNVSLIFNGDCKEALDFYSKVLNGEVKEIHFFKDMPPSDYFTVKDEDKDKVMHSEFVISDNLSIYAVDSIEDNYVKGNHTTLSLNFTSDENIEEAERIFNELSEGGDIKIPFVEQFWGAKYGVFTDKFGNMWEINFML